jgi:hypothetical protein
LDGKLNLMYQDKDRYWLAIQRQLKGYRRINPPAQAKLAAPVRLPHHLQDVGRVAQTACMMAIGDMCLIAFFFLLRVGEYTSHGRGKQ